MWNNCLSGRCLSNTCPIYQGWGCFITTAVFGLIGMLLIIGLAGPIYNDCENKDCATQKDYGLYCDDYCWSGQLGPGSGLVLLISFFLIVALLVPLCMKGRFGGRTRRRIFKDPRYYIDEDMYNEL